MKRISPIRQKKNSVSVVITSRNDSYSGNPLARLQNMLTVLMYLTEKYKAHVECILVEYNPPENTPFISEVLNIPTHTYLTIRCIRVPASYHNKLQGIRHMPMLEWRAKNIGVRRATGDIIVCTNIDILFSEDFMKYLLTASFKKNVFYRINRHDISIKVFPAGTSPQEMLKLSDTHVYRIITKERVITDYKTLQGLKILVVSIIYFLWQYIKIAVRMIKLRTGPGRNELILHDTPYHHGAAGDFLLMHKSAWKKVHGYDETPISGFMDVSILYELGCMGFTQCIIPHKIYHIEHSWGRFGRPTFDVSTFNEMCKKMLRTGIPYVRQTKEWGAPHNTFEEIMM